MKVFSPWFQITVNPVRDGVYMVKWWDGSISLMNWCAGTWHWYDGHPITMQHGGDMHWRGLAFDPASAQECIDIDAPFWVTARPGWWVPKP